MKVFDGTNMIFGRLASRVAKLALQGEEVVIVNAEKILISGNKEDILKKFLWRRSFQNKAKPEHSPKWPKVPHLLVKRMIRGMLPWKKKKGRDAFKRIKVYIGNPGFENVERIEDADGTHLEKAIYIGELCKLLGWKGE